MRDIGFNLRPMYREGWTRQVLVVEDEPFVRGLVVRVLEEAGFTALPAGSAAEALAVVSNHDPDAAILDIELGAGPSGLDLAAALIEHMPHLAIVFLSQAAAPDLAPRGPRPRERAAYLIKRSLSDPQELIRALELVLTDGDPQRAFRDDRSVRTPLSELSSSQLDTMRLIAEGFSNEEIARQRGTSVRAVEAMVSRIFAVLGLSGDSRISPRVAATRIYAEHVGLPSTHRAD